MAAHRTRGDDEVWFSAVWEQDSLKIRQYLARRIPASDADDALESVFLTLWRRRGVVDRSREMTGWLYAAARNEVLNRRRSGSRRARLIEKLTRTHVGAWHERVDDEAVSKTLRSLRPADQEVLTLLYWDGLSVAEIAETLGVNVSSAQKRCERARERFTAAWTEVSEETQSRTGTGKEQT